MTFKAWGKIPRFENEEYCFREKIDGTNGCVLVLDQDHELLQGALFAEPIEQIGRDYIWAQSRTRFVHPGDDNFGFAGWVREHAAELVKLGQGYHYGEWWGRGIQRGYEQTDRHFSLFYYPTALPTDVVRHVPTIKAGSLAEARQVLIDGGSLAQPGFMQPEGVVMYASAAKVYYKSIISK